MRIPTKTQRKYNAQDKLLTAALKTVLASDEETQEDLRAEFRRIEKLFSYATDTFALEAELPLEG